MGLRASAERAAAAIRAQPTSARWLLACDTDADGIAAAAVTAMALRKTGLRFTIRASRDKGEEAYRALVGEAWDGLILLDKGSSHAALLATLASSGAEAGRPPRTIVVVDHHNVPPDAIGVLSGHSKNPGAAQVLLLNPRLEGLDGSRDASAATTAAALALALCGEAALAWAATALVGAIGDRQDEGGWRGWNRELTTAARTAGHLPVTLLPRLGGDDLSLAVAAALSPGAPPTPTAAPAPSAAPPAAPPGPAATPAPPAAPLLPGNDTAANPGAHMDPSLQRAEAESLLSGLAIDRNASVEDLDMETRTRLLSAILLRRIAAGGTPPEPRTLVEEVDLHPVLRVTLRQAYRVADACGREGRTALGIAYLMGDRSSHADAMACLTRHRTKLAAALATLRKDGIERRRGFAVAWTGDAGLTGLVADLAVSTHAMDEGPVRDVPVLVLAHRDDGRIQVSTRGTHELVASGLDLGRTLSVSAKVAGGEGGGHPVAAGAVIDAEQVERFLAALEAELHGARGATTGPDGDPRAPPAAPADGRPHEVPHEH